MATGKKALRFGQAASDYVPMDNSGEIWIRGFKDPATQIRLVPATRENDKGVTVFGTDAWPTEREHYEPAIGSFPCAERFGVECVGCTDPNEAVQQRGRKYYVNAIDEKGQLRVYKLGVNLFKTFKAREQRALSIDPANKQPLSDRDYIINKMGKGLETSYDPEPGEKYKVEWPEELHNIDDILSERYAIALAAYTGEPRSDEEPAEPKAKEKPAAKKDEAPSDADWGSTPSDEKIDAAETDDIKKWLDAQEVEYPSRTPRARLIAMAKEKANEVPF
jgi:hypothetical protein